MIRLDLKKIAAQDNPNVLYHPKQAERILIFCYKLMLAHSEALAFCCQL